MDDLVEAQQLEVAGDELEAERQPVDEGAQLVGEGEVVRTEPEVRIEQPGAIDEEVDRLIGGQRPDRHDRLVDEAQALPAGGQDADPGTGRQERGEELGDLGPANLGAVEHDQAGLVPQGADHAVERAHRPRGWRDRVEQGAGDRMGAGHLVERDVPDRRRGVPGQLERQAGLAGSRRPEEGHQAGAAPDLGQVTSLAGPADQARRRARNPGRGRFRGRCGGRREGAARGQGRRGRR